VAREGVARERRLRGRACGQGPGEGGAGLRPRFAPPGTLGRLSGPSTAAGVTLTELRPLERTLEEVFLEMTGATEVER